MKRTRAQQAELLRDPVRDLVTRSSLRDAAAEIGVSVGAIRNLLEGSTPQKATLEAFASWTARAGLDPALPSRGSPGSRDWKQLDVPEQARTREAGAGAVDAAPTAGTPRPFSAEDLTRWLDAIEALEVDERLKVVKIAELGALFRAHERAQEREIARIRAEADRLAEQAAYERLELLRAAPPVGHIREAGEVEALAEEMVLQQEHRGKQAG